MPDKPNCYDCMHRRNLIGDAHSRCAHPKAGLVGNPNPIAAMVSVISGKTQDGARALGISGNRHGIENGWFLWPANFDPTWLESCNGFDSGAEKADE